MNPEKNSTAEGEYTFKKNLKLLDSTSIVIGSMIGSGVFIVAADMARILGSPGWVLVTWVITGLLTICAALSYGELASMFPKAGGQYVYLREAYNPLIGFLYGWTLFLVIQTGTIAAVAVAFAKFTGVLLPWFWEGNVWLNLGFVKFNTMQALAIFMIIVLSYINLKGINTGKIVQNIFTFTKTAALLGLIVIGLFFISNTSAWEINTKYFWDAAKISGNQIIPLSGFALIAALGTAMVGSLFASVTWENITFTGGEVIKPKKNIPLSLFFGTLIVSIIYILANFVYIKVLPLRGIQGGATVFERGIQFATNDRIGTAAMSMIFGQSAALVMAVFIMISTFGCNNGQILAGARVYYAMAKDGLFFKRAGDLNKHGVPAAGIIIQCFWACLLCLSGTYSDLLDFVVFAVLIFYVMTIAGVFILRIRKPDAERQYKSFGYPIIPAIYILIALIIMVILLIYKPDFTVRGLIIVLLGIPVYFIWKKINRN